MNGELFGSFLEWQKAYKEKVRIRLAFNRLKKELEALALKTAAGQDEGYLKIMEKANELEREMHAVDFSGESYTERNKAHAKKLYRLELQLRTAKEELLFKNDVYKNQFRLLAAGIKEIEAKLKKALPYLEAEARLHHCPPGVSERMDAIKYYPREKPEAAPEEKNEEDKRG